MIGRTVYIPLTDLNRGKASRIIDRLNEMKQSVFIVKNNKPEAVMISVEEYTEFQEYLLQKEVSRRLEQYKAGIIETYTREDILHEFNISEQDLADTENVEFDYD